MSSGQDDAGGDPVCWLQYACPECGAMPTEPSEPSEGPDGRCWRCGEPIPPPGGEVDAS